MFFQGQCLLRGDNPNHRVHASDPINLKDYTLVTESLLGTHVLLTSFADVMDDSSLPVYKAGFFGTYDPSHNRTQMTGREKFAEDKILLLETLPQLLHYLHIRQRRRVPGDMDGFTKAVRDFTDTGKHTLLLDFGAQLFLDIHEVLRMDVTRAWDQLCLYARLAIMSIQITKEFHANRRIANWPKQNDANLDSIVTMLKFWYGDEDQVGTTINHYVSTRLPLYPPSQSPFDHASITNAAKPDDTSRPGKHPFTSHKTLYVHTVCTVNN